MEVGKKYKITLGCHSDLYLCTFKSNYNELCLRRVRKPKSKIDAIRLPEIINIIEIKP